MTEATRARTRAPGSSGRAVPLIDETLLIDVDAVPVIARGEHANRMITVPEAFEIVPAPSLAARTAPGVHALDIDRGAAARTGDIPRCRARRRGGAGRAASPSITPEIPLERVSEGPRSTIGDKAVQPGSEAGVTAVPAAAQLQAGGRTQS